MKRKILVISLLLGAVFGCDSEPKKEEVLQPVPFNEVALNDNFWKPRLITQKEVLVPFALDKAKPAIENLSKTAKFLKGDTTDLPFPHRYIASDLYKIMEGAAYILKTDRDQMLEARMDSIINIIAEAQAPDGYHYESHITGVSRKHAAGGGGGMGNRPYGYVLHSHELYNMGHMYEAAIAYYQATGKRKWLDVAIKNAEHINKVFFVGDTNYNDGKPVNQAPGHQEIELALVKLYRVTNDTLYLNMAKRFLDVRGVTFRPEGRGVMSPTYAQQHAPVREQYKAVGHSVRAMYQYSAMADVSGLCDDPTLRPALDSLWHDIVDKKMHITGGLGALHGIEGFGPDYVLPNKEAYLETCAAVGNVLFNHRMFLMTGNAKYMDVAEVALFNNVLAGVNIEGNRFFYVNPLEADGVTPFNHGKTGRSPWFGTACCPSNLARLLPQVPGMMYAHTGSSIYVTLYATSSSTLALRNGTVTLEQQSDYPFDEKIRITIKDPQQKKFMLKLRIPTWLGDQFVPGELYHYKNSTQRKFQVGVNGKVVDVDVDNGFALIDRTWKEGDVVELTLPMPVRYSGAVEQVEADRGRVAVTRGPLLYCAEAVDNSKDLHQYCVDKSVQDGGVKINTIEDGVLRGVRPVVLEKADLNMIPYYAWNNRSDQAMLVWFAEESDLLTDPDKYATDKLKFKSVKASYVNSGDHVEAMGDNKVPKNSADGEIKRWTSWPRKGEKQWVEIELDKPTDIRSVDIYWYSDGGGVKLPESWSLEYRAGGKWSQFQLYVTDSYGVQGDQFNVVHPAEPIKADAVRININPRKDASVGILEVNIEKE